MRGASRAGFSSAPRASVPARTVAPPPEADATPMETVATQTERLSLQDQMKDMSFNEVKVSQNTTTRKLAGALAHVARSRRSVNISALSPANVNTAIKAVAVARDYVKDDGLEIAVSVEFRDETRRSVALKLVNFDRRFENASEHTYNVGKTSKPSTLAGAIAARLRENHQPVLSCVGAGSLARAITAVCVTANYLKKEDKGAVFVVPFFTDEKKVGSEESISILNMQIVQIDV